MEISAIGILICLLLMLLGRRLGSALIVGGIASTAFGATAVATLTAIGGSSPLIYLIFGTLICGLFLFSPTFPRDITTVFRSGWVPWVVCGLAVYALASAVILPRVFAGTTGAFVASRGVGVIEIALAPSAGNLTQTGYFLVGAMSFLAISGILVREQSLELVRRGFFLWATIVATTGALDLAGKLAGLGDLLSPVRTASFAFLTDVEQGGFWRISGMYSEASTFGGAAVAALAFTFAFWKVSGTRASGTLAAALLILVALSTSSSAYASLTILSVMSLTSMSRSTLRGYIKRRDALIMAVLALLILVVASAAIYDQHLLEPFQKLMQSTIFDKSQSESGKERAYWNERSLMSLFDTWGFGIGFGSSRASNWAIAVLSQLGVLGALLQFSLIVPVLNAVPPKKPSEAGQQTIALYAGLRACIAAMLTSSFISGGTADPGFLFFVALGAMLACGAALQQRMSPLQRLTPSMVAR